jgi:hypothetical protein
MNRRAPFFNRWPASSAHEMMEVAKAVAATLLLVSPWLAIIIFSWIRWARVKQSRTLSSILSFTGLVLATASVLLAFLPSFYPPSHEIARAVGFLVALAAVFFAVAGAWRPSPLRWRALACGAAMLLFWFLAFVLE